MVNFYEMAKETIGALDKIQTDAGLRLSYSKVAAVKEMCEKIDTIYKVSEGELPLVDIDEDDNIYVSFGFVNLDVSEVKEEFRYILFHSVRMWFQTLDNGDAEFNVTIDSPWVSTI